MRGKPYSFTGLTGGLNLADSPYELANNEARDLLNVVATGRGAIKKRNGCTPFASSLSPTETNSLGSLDAPAGSFLVAASTSSVLRIDVGGFSSSIFTLANSAGRWSFAQAPGGLYMANGVENPLRWPGIGTASQWTGTNIPNARYLLYKSTRMWAASMTSYGGVTDPGSCLTFSELGDPATFPLENIVLFDPNDGEAISGIASVGPYILVAKPSKLWIVYDLDTGANRPLTAGLGCMSHRSMAEGPGGVWFLANDNSVNVCDGAKVQRISDKIRPLLETVTPASKATAAGAFFDGHYYLSAQLSSGARTLDFDSVLGSWFVHSYAPADWESWAPSGDPQLYAVRGTAVDHAWVSGVGADAAVAFDSYWRGPYLTFGAPFLNKRVRRIHFDGTGRIRVGLSRNFASLASFEGEANFGPASLDLWGQGTDLWGQGTDLWGGEAEVGEAEVLTPGVARAWSVQFGNNSADPWEVNSYTLAVQTRRDD